MSNLSNASLWAQGVATASPNDCPQSVQLVVMACSTLVGGGLPTGAAAGFNFSAEGGGAPHLEPAAAYILAFIPAPYPEDAFVAQIFGAGVRHADLHQGHEEEQITEVLLLTNALALRAVAIPP